MTQQQTSSSDLSPTRDRPRRRPPRRPVVVTLAVVGAVLLAVGLALFQPWRLLTRSTIDEPLPAAAATSVQPMPAESPTAASELSPPATRAAAGSATAPAAPRVLSEGRFSDAEHATSGTARVLELAGGSRYLRLEGFSTSDGPDVHVWITDQPAGADWGRYDDGVHVALGALKATDGNQNYAIPEGVDLTRLTSAVIWCDRFNVAFGTAPIRIA